MNYKNTCTLLLHATKQIITPYIRFDPSTSIAELIKHFIYIQFAISQSKYARWVCPIVRSFVRFRSTFKECRIYLISHMFNSREFGQAIMYLHIQWICFLEDIKIGNWHTNCILSQLMSIVGAYRRREIVLFQAKERLNRSGT